MAKLKTSSIMGELLKVSAIVEMNDSYIRYENGVQIVAGNIQATKATTVSITFPRQFKEGTKPAFNFVVEKASYYSDSNYMQRISNLTNTGVDASDWMIRGANESVSYIAIGY